jgi:hypothetical protein
MTSNVCYNIRALFIFTHHVSQSQRLLKNKFQNSRSCSMGANLISHLSEVLPTFYKHVIVVDLDNSSWMLELGAKFSL